MAAERLRLVGAMPLVHPLEVRIIHAEPMLTRRLRVGARQGCPLEMTPEQG